MTRSINLGYRSIVTDAKKQLLLMKIIELEQKNMYSEIKKLQRIHGLPDFIIECEDNPYTNEFRSHECSNHIDIKPHYYIDDYSRVRLDITVYAEQHILLHRDNEGPHYLASYYTIQDLIIDPFQTSLEDFYFYDS